MKSFIFAVLFLIEEFFEFFVDKGRQAYGLYERIKKDDGKEGNVDVSICDIHCKKDKEHKGDNKHKYLCQLGKNEYPKLSLSCLIGKHCGSEMHMGGGGNKGVLGCFYYLASVNSAYMGALSLEMKAERVEGLGTVIGDLRFEILFDMLIDLFTVVIKIM